MRKILVMYEIGRSSVFLGKRWVRVFGFFYIYDAKNNIVAAIKCANVAFITFADAVE